MNKVSIPKRTVWTYLYAVYWHSEHFGFCDDLNAILLLKPKCKPWNSGQDQLQSSFVAKS